MENKNRKLCACGCKEQVTWNKVYKRWNTYIHGHHIRGENNPQKALAVREKTSKTLMGHIVTKETLQKIIDKRKLQVFSKEDCKKMSDSQILLWSNSGERKQKMSERMSGENSPSWKNEKSSRLYSGDFSNRLKEIIRFRDGNVCVLCLTPEFKLNRKLDIHHIDYDKYNCSSDNLVSLCPSCHSKTNGNREDWQSVFASQ